MKSTRPSSCCDTIVETKLHIDIHALVSHPEPLFLISILQPHSFSYSVYNISVAGCCVDLTAAHHIAENRPRK